MGVELFRIALVLSRDNILLKRFS